MKLRNGSIQKDSIKGLDNADFFNSLDLHALTDQANIVALFCKSNGYAKSDASAAAGDHCRFLHKKCSFQERGL